MKRELTNSWDGENTLSSHGSWEGTEQPFGALKSEAGGDEQFLLYDGGLADQKCIDVQH